MNSERQTKVLVLLSAFCVIGWGVGIAVGSVPVGIVIGLATGGVFAYFALSESKANKPENQSSPQPSKQRRRSMSTERNIQVQYSDGTPFPQYRCTEIIVGNDVEDPVVEQSDIHIAFAAASSDKVGLDIYMSLDLAEALKEALNQQELSDESVCVKIPV